MAEQAAVLEEPSLINEPLKEPVATPAPESKLFPDPVKTPPAPAKPAEPKATTEVVKTEPEPAKPKEETKQEPSKPSTEVKTTPVDYENLKLPEGNLLSAEEVAAVKKDAKENGMSAEETQGVLEVKNDAVKAFQARQTESIKVAQKEWKENWLKDPEFGGDKATESTEVAKRTWDRFADNELKTLANTTGLGNHPAVMRMMARIGRVFSEDKLVRGSLGGDKPKKSAAEILYGGTTPNSDAPMS